MSSLGKRTLTPTNMDVKDAFTVSLIKAVGIKTCPMLGGHGVSTVTHVLHSNIEIQSSDYAIPIKSRYSEQ